MIRKFMLLTIPFIGVTISLWFALFAAISLVGCRYNPVIYDPLDEDETHIQDSIGKILMHQTGGIAGISRIISIGEKDGQILLVRMDQRTDQREEALVSPEDLSQLWNTLEANDVFILPTKLDMTETVMDAFFFEITLERGQKYNRFSVYAPDLLPDEERYSTIVQAIQDFADSHLQVKAGRIEGNVTDLQGKPVPGLVVSIVGGTTSFPEIAVITDQQGYYRIESVPEGTFQVAAHDDQGNRIGIGSVTVRSGETVGLNLIVPTQGAEDLIIACMPVTDISVEVLESFPLQVHLIVKGFLRDACTTLNETTQWRDGNTIYVSITTKRPRDIFCIQVIKEVDIRVPLEGGFLPGKYKAIVNGVVKEFEIR